MSQPTMSRAERWGNLFTLAVVLAVIGAVIVIGGVVLFDWVAELFR